MVLPADVTVRPASAGEAAQIADAGVPRFILGYPEEAYHARPEVSASGLKVLVGKSPKHFQQARAVRVEKAEYDVGHAVHERVLGVGLGIVEIDPLLLSADGGVRSNAAKAEVQNIRAAGKVPLKPAVYREVVKASDAVLMHPKARLVLEVPGESEVSMFGTDLATGVRLRGRADRLSVDPVTGVVTVVDVKTCTDLAVHKLRAVVDSFGYDLQGEAYRYLVELITGELAAPVVLIFCEKEPPYDVRVVRLGDDWIEGGWRKLRQALDMYAACVEARSWPGVDEGPGPIDDLSAPGWYAARNDRAEVGLED